MLRTHLKPYFADLTKREKRKPEAKVWGLLEARWAALIKHCKDILRVREDGAISDRWAAEAAAELVRVAEQAKARDAWRTAVATVLLRENDARMFASDKAFKVQLGRRVRHLAEANRGTWYDAATGGTKTAYRDPSPRAAVLIGQWLAETFGVVGVAFAEQDRAEAEQKKAERMTFREALREATTGAAAPLAEEAA